MEVLGIRFCAVAEEAQEMAEFFSVGLGLPERDLGGGEGFHGAVIPAGTSWIEIWQKAADMPVGLMLQIVVDDADAVVAAAAAAGGQLVVPPWDVPGVGRMGVLQSADGAYFSIFRPVPQS